MAEKNTISKDYPECNGLPVDSFYRCIHQLVRNPPYRPLFNWQDVPHMALATVVVFVALSTIMWLCSAKLQLEYEANLVRESEERAACRCCYCRSKGLNESEKKRTASLERLKKKHNWQ
jgi:hypothetical protein